MPVGELSFRAFLPNYTSNLCQDELAVLPAQRIKVQSHNEYQSNRVMNRNAVKGRQAKLRDRHDTMRVVNVSISVSSLSASHRITTEYMLMEEQMISSASPGFCARGTRNEASTAKTETTVGLMGGQSGLGP